MTTDTERTLQESDEFDRLKAIKDAYVRIEWLEEENHRLLRLREEEVWIAGALFQLLTEHGIKPSSGELLAAYERHKEESAAHIDTLEARVTEVEGERDHWKTAYMNGAKEVQSAAYERCRKLVEQEQQRLRIAQDPSEIAAANILAMLRTLKETPDVD